MDGTNWLYTSLKRCVCSLVCIMWTKKSKTTTLKCIKWILYRSTCLKHYLFKFEVFLKFIQIFYIQSEVSFSLRILVHKWYDMFLQFYVCHTVSSQQLLSFFSFDSDRSQNQKSVSVWKIGQRELFVSEVNKRKMIAAIEANNNTYCLQKRIEKFPLIRCEKKDNGVYFL